MCKEPDETMMRCAVFFNICLLKQLQYVGKASIYQ